MGHGHVQPPHNPPFYTSTGGGLCLKVVHTRRRWCVTFRRAGVCWRWDWCSSKHHFDGALRGFANDLRPGGTMHSHTKKLTISPDSIPRCFGRSAVDSCVYIGVRMCPVDIYIYPPTLIVPNAYREINLSLRLCLECRLILKLGLLNVG